MAQDYNLWVNDITHRFSPTSLTDSLSGSLYTSTALISGVTTNSSPKMSQWDAYFDLRNKLLEISDTIGASILPKSTTAELAALTGIIDGQSAQNITEQRDETCLGSAWVSSAGATSDSGTNGSMYENNTNGSPMDSTTHRWNTAASGNTPTGMTFAKVSSGDTYTVDTAGLGARFISFYASFTNAGGKLTTATLLVNGVASIITIGIQGDSGNHRGLAAGDTITLADGDVCTLEIVSATATDTVNVYQCHVNFGNV